MREGVNHSDRAAVHDRRAVGGAVVDERRAAPRRGARGVGEVGDLLEVLRGRRVGVVEAEHVANLVSNKWVYVSKQVNVQLILT